VINLLPPSYRQTLRLNRLHSVARRWLFIVLLATIGLALVLATGWFYINKQEGDLKQSIATTNAELTAQNLSQVQKDAKTLTNNIKTINEVLSREIRFSDLIKDIGRVMPPGAILSALSVSKVSGGIDLQANAKDHPSAAQVAVNLSDPSKDIFSKIDIVSITCNPVQTTNNGYPCFAIYRAQFSATAHSRYQGLAKEDQ